MAVHDSLRDAKKSKKDEFYTRYEDIQAELNHYEKHFKGKTVLCNCDDPFESNFCKFFLKNFNYLKLKRLICTSYTSSPFVGTQMSLFDSVEEPLSNNHGYVIDIMSVPMANGRGVSDDDIDQLLHTPCLIKKLIGDGDFASDECIDYLDAADIVVTNPPFSLFRKYIALLMEHNKKFLVLSNMNAITYREFFPLLRDNKIWSGYGFNLSMVYKTPYPNTLEANAKFVRSKGLDPNQGFVKVPGICWFTNLDIQKRHEELVLYKKYDPSIYPKYYNFDAINVDKVTEIPMDYDGLMGVPITFLDRHNPNQFEIVGLGISNSGIEIGVKPYEKKHKEYRKTVQKRGAVDGDLYMLDENGHPDVPYARIIIRRKKEEV